MPVLRREIQLRKGIQRLIAQTLGDFRLRQYRLVGLDALLVVFFGVVDEAVEVIELRQFVGRQLRRSFQVVEDPPRATIVFRIGQFLGLGKFLVGLLAHGPGALGFLLLLFAFLRMGGRYDAPAGNGEDQQ